MGSAPSSGSAIRSRRAAQPPRPARRSTSSPSTSADAGQRDVRASSAVTGAIVRRAGPADDLGVDEHPLVAQPHHGSAGLRRAPPARPGSAGRRRARPASRTTAASLPTAPSAGPTADAPRRAPDHRLRRQLTGHRLRPVHVDPGIDEPARAVVEQRPRPRRRTARPGPARPRPGAGAAAATPAPPGVPRSWCGSGRAARARCRLRSTAPRRRAAPSGRSRRRPAAPRRSCRRPARHRRPRCAARSAAGCRRRLTPPRPTAAGP